MSLPCESPKVQSSSHRRVIGDEPDDGGAHPAHGPFAGSPDPEAIARYVAATGDRTASVLDGLATPAVFPVILVFAPNEAARGDLPKSVWRHVRGGLHGAHDIVLHRPLVPGELLQTWSQISAVRTTRSGTQVVTRFEQVDADGAIVARAGNPGSAKGTTTITHGRLELRA